MCTVSWCHQPNGYTLFFNRDESRSRPTATPPKERVVGHTRCIHPTDPEGGGTWLLVNQYGLSFGLLNFYEAQISYQPANRQSRGQLPLKFANCDNLSAVEQALGEHDLTPFPPLHFLAVEPLGQAILFTWDGKSKSVTHPTWEDLPISTSSFETDKVIEARRSHFWEQISDQSDRIPIIESFHTTVEPTPAEYAALMSRPDAKTVSITRIDVSDTKVAMSYRARPDDSANLADPLVLTTRRA